MLLSSLTSATRLDGVFRRTPTVLIGHVALYYDNRGRLGVTDVYQR